MQHLIHFFFRAIATTSLSLLASAAWCAPPLQPIENFTKRPVLSDVHLSPSGNHMAFIMFNKQGRRTVGVMNLNPVGEAKVVGSFGDAYVTNVSWVNDRRLVFQAFQDGAVIREGGAGTCAVNADGGDYRQLISWRYPIDTPSNSLIRSRVLPYDWYLGELIDDDSDDVFVYRVIYDNLDQPKQIELARLNTASGELRRLSHGMPESVWSWLLDQKNEPRVVTSFRAGRTKVSWRDPASAQWVEIAEFDSFASNGVMPLRVEADGQIIVRARLNGDAAALYRFDPVNKRIDPQPMLQVKGFDLPDRPDVDSRSKRLLGWHFTADRSTSYWLDEGMERIQASIDKALPAGRSNRLHCGRCETSRFIVIESSSDRQPGEYFLYDREKTSLTRIGASRSWINENEQGTRTFHRVTTRDGLQMPVYVTHPVRSTATTPLPSIVLVHGGPWIRGASLRWDAEAQFLASRGYRVLEPEFRGSTGYGWKLFHSSWKQWGLSMQDDLADAVQWAAKHGLVDASKVCVSGGGYGGYASLMAPIATPGIFKCAASFAGVTDIDFLFSNSWSNFSKEYKEFGLSRLVGDREKDAAQIARTSPVKRVAEIKIPVLLGHGGQDRRVPVKHAAEFADAARRVGVNLEQVIYPEEGHGFFDPKNATDYYARLEKFFAKSLQKSN